MKHFHQGTNVPQVEPSAPTYCTSLKSVVIPDSVNTIGYRAFSYCVSLESVVVGDSVNTINEHAFFDCTSLKSIIIPESIISIQKNVFTHCPSLKIITIDGQTTEYLKEYFETNYPEIDLEFSHQYLLK